MEITNTLLRNKDKLSIRYFSQIKNVLFDKNVREKEDTPLYYMYRGIKILPNNIRYDITVIPSRLMGKEFIKTKGHRHNDCKEIYSILAGKAIFLLQKTDSEGNISDLYAIKAKKGDIIIIPPKYDHLTINPLKNKKLILENWIKANCVSDYGFIEQKRGACLFYTVGGWIKNKNYNNVPKLTFKEPLKNLPNLEETL